MPLLFSPLISIIVLNRNGLTHLKTLLPALSEYTSSEEYELIMIDNASTDQSIEYLRRNEFGLPMVLVENNQNLSFSEANNKAANIAKGKYLLLLNNDVIPSKNWLHKLLKPIENNKNIAAVGAKLVYPQKKGFKNAGLVQHAGITFVYEGDVVRPYNLGNTYPIDHPIVTSSTSRPALTAACLLVHKGKYFEVGGLDESYLYGFEDVDLGLKFLKAGYINYYCADVTLIHCEFGTQSKDKRTEVVKRRQKNLEFFRKRWFHFLKKAYWNEKLNNQEPFFAESSLVIAFAGAEKSAAKSDDLEILKKVFKSDGWKVVDLHERRRTIKLEQNIDIVLSFSPSIRFKTCKTRKRQMKVLCLDSDLESYPKNIINILYSVYDIVLATTAKDVSSELSFLHFLYYQNCLPHTLSGKPHIDLLMKHCAKDIKTQLLKVLTETSIAIILPIKKWQNAKQWQGYKVALYLKQALVELGHSVLFQIVSRGNNLLKECNAVIVIDGLNDHKSAYQVNLTWCLLDSIAQEKNVLKQGLPKQEMYNISFLRVLLNKLNYKSTNQMGHYAIKQNIVRQYAESFSESIKAEVELLKKGE